MLSKVCNIVLHYVNGLQEGSNKTTKPKKADQPSTSRPNKQVSIMNHSIIKFTNLAVISECGVEKRTLRFSINRIQEGCVDKDTD